MSLRLGVNLIVTGKGEEATGSHSSIFIPMLFANPQSGVDFSRPSNSLLAGRTMYRARLLTILPCATLMSVVYVGPTWLKL